MCPPVEPKLDFYLPDSSYHVTLAYHFDINLRPVIIMFSWLAPRITVMMMLILGIGVVITTTLSTHKFDDTLDGFLTSRYKFVIDEIRQHVETNLNIGIALTDLQDINREIIKHRQTDDQILSIEIFDSNGTVLFSTDPSFVSDQVSDRWWRASRSQQQVWAHSERDARVVGGPIYDGFGQNVGSVALRYTRIFFDHHVAAQTYYLMIVCAVVVVIMLVFSMLGAIGSVRSVRADIRDLGDALNDLSKGRDGGGVQERTQTTHPEFADFAATVLTAQRDIDNAIQEIRRLDEDDAV